jgi:hypothetical protein
MATTNSDDVSFEGTVSSDITKVLDKWKSEYSTLLNQQRDVIAVGSSHESCSTGKRTFNDYLFSSIVLNINKIYNRT